MATRHRLPSAIFPLWKDYIWKTPKVSCAVTLCPKTARWPEPSIVFLLFFLLSVTFLRHISSYIPRHISFSKLFFTTLSLLQWYTLNPAKTTIKKQFKQLFSSNNTHSVTLIDLGFCFIKRKGGMSRNDILW